MSVTKTTTKKPKAKAAAGRRHGSSDRSARGSVLSSLEAVQGIVGKLMTMAFSANDGDTLDQLKARFKDRQQQRREARLDDTRDAATIRADVNETLEETIRFAQAVRRIQGDPSGRLTSTIARMCVSLGEDRWLFDDQATRDVLAKMKEFKERKGLHVDHEWPTGKAPEAYQLMEAEADACYDAVIVGVMRGHGEHDLAKMYQDDQDGFDRLMDEGREKAADKGTRS